MEQRSVKLRVVTNKWTSRSCRHGKAEGVGFIWLTLYDGEKYEFCFMCLTECVGFVPQIARIMRNWHKCSKCGKKAVGVKFKQILMDQRVFVCLECLEAYARGS